MIQMAPEHGFAVIWHRPDASEEDLAELDLSVEAKTTARYVSFVETGRSRPSALCW